MQYIKMEHSRSFSIQSIQYLSLVLFLEKSTINLILALLEITNQVRDKVPQLFECGLLWAHLIKA